ncbi:MAG TPA: hypothetical protein VLS88_02975 [Polyangiales bacterium]|nr:hypothetical protein [Polyangiales bacterium]
MINRTCIVIGAILAFGFGAPAYAEPTQPACEDGSTACDGEPECKSECTYRCKCKRGIFATDYKNLILIIAGSTFAGRIELEYERALHDRVSVFGAFYAVAFDSLGNDALVGFGGLGGARVNLVGRAPEGIWFAWQVGGFRRNARGSQEVQLRGVQTGGMFGWTGVWKRFAFTIGAGGTYTYGRVKVLDQSVYDSEWNPWLRLGLGVAF